MNMDFKNYDWYKMDESEMLKYRISTGSVYCLYIFKDDFENKNETMLWIRKKSVEKYVKKHKLNYVKNLDYSLGEIK